MTDRLFDVGAIEVAPTAAVLAFNPLLTRNSERIIELAALGYLPEPVLDPTHGLGGMWYLHTPVNLTTCDIVAGRGQVRCDFTALPFRDRSFASCVYDPPYKMGSPEVTYEREQSIGGRHDGIAYRYGVESGRHQGVEAMMLAGLDECMRVTRRFLIVKCQDQIGNGFEWQTGMICNHAIAGGWRIKDMLHLNNTIGQPPGTPQHHARRNYSTFVVLRC